MNMNTSRKIISYILLLITIFTIGCSSKETEPAVTTIILRMPINRIEPVDTKGMAAFNVDGKWGYLDVTKGVAVEADYDQVMPYQLGYGVVVKDGQYQMVDRNGDFVLDDWLTSTIRYDDITEAYTYFDRDQSKHIILPLETLEEPEPFYREAYGGWDMGDYRYHVVNDKGNLYDKKRKKLMFDQYYTTLREVHKKESDEENYHFFIAQEGEYLGFFEVHAGDVREIVYGVYDGGRLFEDTESIIMASGIKKELYDFQGNLLFEAGGIDRQMASNIADGRIAYKEAGKWGYLDGASGQVVVEPFYHEANDFVNGYAVVKLNRYEFGIINANGDLVMITGEHE